MKRVYLCDHCGGHLGTFTKPSACRKHEAACDYNPANRTCGTCKHQMFDEYFMRRKKRKCAVVGLTMYRQGCEHHESRLSSNDTGERCAVAHTLNPIVGNSGSGE